MFIPSVPDFILVSFIFFAAGAVKGILGMGLPTVAMGLLGLVMPVAQAAALLAAPSLVTNVWQAARGAHLRALARRLWPLQAGVVAGVVAGAGFMQAGSGRPASLLLGACLVAYAAAGLLGWRLPAPRRGWEGGVSAGVGVLTGLLTAATGVFVLPAVPYLQALALDKDEMAQALGLSFTVSTLALAAVLAVGGHFAATAAWWSLLVLAPAIAGMWLGQRLRDELTQAAFRRLFFGGLLLLGVALVVRHF